MTLGKISKRHQTSIPAIRVALTSFVVDLTDIVFNLIVALLSGSVILTTQWLQGIADLVSSALIVIGVERSKKPADQAHPFGYGRELFFWTLLASLFMITVTATLSFYLGVQKLFHPASISHLPLAFFVLTLGIFTNGYALSLSWKRLRRSRPLQSLSDIFFHSPLIETKTTFVLDLIGTLASLVGFLALLIYSLTNDLRFDALGAITISIILFILAFILLFSVRDLIIGRRASSKIERQIILSVENIWGVVQVLDLRTSIIGPESILVNLEVQLLPNLTTQRIERVIDRIKLATTTKIPSIKHIQVEIETPDRPPHLLT